jgi:hypothetical protein
MKQIQITIVFLLFSLCALWAQTSGSGTTNYIPVWTNSTTLGNSIMYQTSGRIGINTTSPQYALDVSGHINTSSGYLIGEDMVLSLPGSQNNLAVGWASIPSSTTGEFNTVAGIATLTNNSSGGSNTGIGYGALFGNTSGSFNTATGFEALTNNSGGEENTADGFEAILGGSGSYNTATGFEALYSGATYGNVANGYEALYSTTGSYNTAVGYEALLNSTSGGANIAIGSLAGANIGSGFANIDIGNVGASTDNDAIRIGTLNEQTSFFAAGVRGVTTGENNAVPVVIDSNGQLGTVSSSRRFKTDIQDMGDASSGLMRLRPVTFRYKKLFADGSQPIQYGLIAEEVAKVYPDLVARSADGEIESVKYQVLDSMLLNELQRQRAEVRNLQDQLRELKTAVAATAHAPQALCDEAIPSQDSEISWFRHLQLGAGKAVVRPCAQSGRSSLERKRRIVQ